MEAIQLNYAAHAYAAPKSPMFATPKVKRTRISKGTKMFLGYVGIYVTVLSLGFLAAWSLVQLFL